MSAPAQRRQPPGAARTDEAPPALVRVRVWDRPVRWVHWLLFLDIIVLSVSGFLVEDPVPNLAGNAASIISLKTIHKVFAYIFIALILARVAWLFQSPNRWCRWREWIPTSKARLRAIVPSVRFYVFLDREPPPVVGHNPLAGLTYTLLYLMFIVEILTGTIIFGIQGVPWARFLTGWMVPMVSLQMIRFIHQLIMWLIAGFLIHHVYSCMLVDYEEKSGLISSIFSGFKFLPRNRL
jgi:Ni/Fe-hydrogenase 1 B-type cytochrome subunit